MGKGAAKFGGKSGVLPEVRQIFKKPVKPVVRPANPNAGYAEGVEHPKGTSRSQPVPEARSVIDLIQNTARDPKKLPDLHSADAAHRDNVSKAALRRQYYNDVLRKEEKKLEYKEANEQQRQEEEEKRIAEHTYEMSEASKLTLPTISKILEGPLMRDRTPEEKEILAAKRKANRLQNELRGKENRAANLLELFYEADEYITTEEDLNAAIAKAFDSNGIGYRPYDANTQSRSYDERLSDALFGTINNKPGLVEVEEQINGERAEFLEEITKEAKRQLAAKEQKELEGLSNSKEA